MDSKRLKRASLAAALLAKESPRDQEALRRYFDGDTHTAIWCALKYPRLRDVQDLCERYKSFRGPTLNADIATLAALKESLESF